ncbi:hypothetical protein [Konateibacter massiliensis]|uniref:hypothetical protein n=1 Tax=Konateibacter massiliensis TaxID=2002841 RepID=UPI000C155370|nr:hypothetical protein [Konateibacter massiliensis]
MNKKVKQVLAIIGIVILVGLYVATFIFALLDSPNAASWFKAALYSTVVVPVLLYAYLLVYKYLKNRR